MALESFADHEEIDKAVNRVHDLLADARDPSLIQVYLGSERGDWRVEAGTLGDLPAVVIKIAVG